MKRRKNYARTNKRILEATLSAYMDVLTDLAAERQYDKQRIALLESQVKLQKLNLAKLQRENSLV